MSTKKKSIKGTRTEKNLAAAYLAESSAYSRYTFYAKQADKESYFPIGHIFRETAENELSHAKVFFKFLQGGKAEATMDIDAGVIGTTAKNLKLAISEEQQEGVVAYSEAAKVADEEGFHDIAEVFRSIAEIEKTHEARFRDYLKQVNNGTVWKRKKPITWKCLVCGYEFVGTEPPEVCPACDHPREHYIAVE